MLTIVIPAAGRGQRFADAGYEQPKPLVDVCGKPMIQRVVENVRTDIKDTTTVIVTRAEHHVEDILKDSFVIPIDWETDGAVSTVLVAEQFLNDSPLVIANCDQLILGLDMAEFLKKMEAYDAGAMTFNSTNPHHSYLKLGPDGCAVEVAEKVVISDNAVVGIYYYKSGLEFLKYANKMIADNTRVNGEFYISPIFNEYIADNKKVGIYEIDVHQKHILGTPAELQIFLDKVANGTVSL